MIVENIVVEKRKSQLENINHGIAQKIFNTDLGLQSGSRFIIRNGSRDKTI